MNKPNLQFAPQTDFYEKQGFEHWPFLYFHGKCEDKVAEYLNTLIDEYSPAPDLIAKRGAIDEWYEGEVTGVLHLGLNQVPVIGVIWIDWWIQNITKSVTEPPPEGWIVQAQSGVGDKITYGIKKPQHHRGLICLADDEVSLAYARGRFYERALCL